MSQDTNYIDQKIRNHIHDGNLAQRVNFPDLFLYTEPINVTSATIATTGTTDAYFLAPRSLSVFQVDFSGADALAANDSNYITWTITNLGQAGTGSAAILLSSNLNTTKATGGSGIAANTKRTLVINTVVTSLSVVQGDRIRIRATVTGTLVNTVTFPNYLIQLQ